ncbi:MAG: RNase P subunit p30 family protein [Methanobacteriota archaeon]
MVTDKLFFDLLVGESLVDELAGLGFSGACVVGKGLLAPKGFQLLCSKVVSDPVQNNARNALSSHDLVYFELADDVSNRKASECWEVDAFIVSADFVKNYRPLRKPALDFVSLKNMGERGIAIIIPVSLLLESTGFFRANTLNCFKRLVRLAGKAKVDVVLASGAKEKYGIRSPKDLMAVGVALGIPANVVVKTVSDNPLRIVNRAESRTDPNVILEGLTVLEWGDQKPVDKKRLWGFY